MDADAAAAMDVLEEDSFALSSSCASDAEFDAMVGYLEGIIIPVITEEFHGQVLPGVYKPF